MRKIAENIAATLPNLVLNANKIAESVWAGIYSKKKTGPGRLFGNLESMSKVILLI